MLVMFGPHIGIDSSGTLGKCYRAGQKNVSGACGAVLAAYSSCCSGDACSADPHDLQQSWLKQRVSERMDKIQVSEFPLATLIYEAFEAIKENLLSIVNHDFGSGK